MVGTIKKMNGEYCDVEIEGGGKVKALKINVGEVGSKTKLSVRPERITINQKNTEQYNNFKGQVKELIYLGDHIRARLAVCGNEEFIVKIPNEGNIDLKEGSPISVSWSALDIRALDYS